MKTEILVPSFKNSSICVHDVSTSTAEYVYDYHIHNECELLFLLDGEMTVWVNEKEYTLYSGDIIFINENIPHKTRKKSNSTDFLMQMRREFEADTINKYLFRYISRIGTDSVFRTGSELNLKIRDCIENIITENENRNPSYDKFIKAEVLKIFAYLYRYNIIPDPMNHFDAKNINRILPVLDFVDIHYAESVSLSRMSTLLNVDKAHFCRIFKKAINTSFVQYLNFVRVIKAEKLLLSTDKNILEIAEETGFSSPAYFAEVFKLNMGCSPSYYKKIKLQICIDIIHFNKKNEAYPQRTASS